MQSSFYSLSEEQWSHLDGWPPGFTVESNNSCMHMDQEGKMRARENVTSHGKNEHG